MTFGSNLYVVKARVIPTGKNFCVTIYAIDAFASDVESVECSLARTHEEAITMALADIDRAYRSVEAGRFPIIGGEDLDEPLTVQFGNIPFSLAWMSGDRSYAIERAKQDAIGALRTMRGAVERLM